MSSHRTPLIPSTLVAVNADGETLGAVGLVAHDPEGLPDRSPWVVGTVVRTDFRARGVGGLLMGHLEKHAGDLGVLWVATQRAAGFYARCGYLLLPSKPSVLCLDLSRPSE